MADWNWMLNRIKDAGLNQSQFAAALGVHRSLINQWIGGKTGMPWKHVVTASKLVGRTPIEIAQHVGTKIPEFPEKRAAVPVEEMATEGFELVKRDASGGPATVERPWNLAGSAKALRVRLPMSPMDGWTIFYVPVTRIEPGAFGKLCVVSLAGRSRRRYLRVLAQGYEPGRYTLLELTGDISTALVDVEVASAAPVIGIRC